MHAEHEPILFAALGAGGFLLLGLHGRAHMGIAGWLLVTVPVAMLTELILGLVCTKAFSSRDHPNAPFLTVARFRVIPSAIGQ